MASPAPAPSTERPAAAALAAGRGTVERTVAQVREAVPDPAAPFGLVVRLRAKPEHLQGVLASYAGQARAAAANPGSLVYHVNQDAADPTALLLYEVWRDLPAFIAHETSEGTVAHFGRIAAWLEAERTLTVVVDALGRGQAKR